MPSYTPSSTTRSSIDTFKSGKSTSNDSLIESPITMPAVTKSPSKTRQAWEFVKKHAKEHHESVNAAYAVYYSAGQGPRGTVREEK